MANTKRIRPVRAKLHVEGLRCASARAFEICADPEMEIDETNWDDLEPDERMVPIGRPWQFPPASVTVVEIRTEKEGC